MFGYVALETAATGDDLASGRFLEHTRAAVACSRYESPGWGTWSAQGFLSGWDGVRPQTFTARRSLELGRAAEALQVFDVLGTPETPFHRATRQVDIMTACVALGDLDRACAAGHGALDTAVEHELGIVAVEVGKARAMVPAGTDTLPLVRELDERLRLVA